MGRRMGGATEVFLEVDSVRIVERQLAVLRPVLSDVFIAGPPALRAPRAPRRPERNRRQRCPWGVRAALAHAAASWVSSLACDLPFPFSSASGLVPSRREATRAVEPSRGGFPEPRFASSRACLFIYVWPLRFLLSRQVGRSAAPPTSPQKPLGTLHRRGTRSHARAQDRRSAPQATLPLTALLAHALRFAPRRLLMCICNVGNNSLRRTDGCRRRDGRCRSRYGPRPPLLRLGFFAPVGLLESAVKESKVRVASAIKNSGFDLPIALGVLAAAGIVEPAALESHLFAGELALPAVS
jgi:hypothetical protein